jgi:hypothetical protein
MSGYAWRDILTDSEITAFYSRFTTLIVSRNRGEYAVTLAPRGQEFHLHENQVIKNQMILVTHPLSSLSFG